MYNKIFLLLIFLLGNVNINCQQIIPKLLGDDIIANGGQVININSWLVNVVQIPISTDNLILYWDSGIRLSDGALYNEYTNSYDTLVKVLNYTAGMPLDSISLRSELLLKVYNDTIPVACMPGNYNLSDTIYTQLTDYGVTELAIYSTQKIGQDSLNLHTYFNIEAITYDAIVDPSGNGDYTTINAAISGEAHGANIGIKSGNYEETDYVYWRYQNLIGVGDVNLTSTGTNYVVIASSTEDRQFKNIQIDGQGYINYGMLVSGTADLKTISNCYFENCDNNITINSTVTDPIFVVDKCVLKSSDNMGTYNVRSTKGDLVFTNSYIDFTEGRFQYQDGAHNLLFQNNIAVTTGTTSERIEVITCDTVNVINCNFISNNAAGYALLIGAEETGVYDYTMNMINVQNCNFICETTPTTIHGGLFGFQDNPIIQNCTFENYGIALVLKGSNTDNDGSMVSGNTFTNNLNDIYLKGTNKNHIINNTFYSDVDNCNNMRLSINTGGDESINNTFSNNIMYNVGNGKLFYIVDNNSTYGITGDANVFYKTDELYINLESVISGYSTLDGIFTNSSNENPY